MFEWVGKNFNKSSEKAVPAEFGQGAGRNNEAVYRGEVSPLGADPGQLIEFSLTPAESEEAQRGLLAAKEAAGRVDTERIEVVRDRIFGNQAEASPAPDPVGTEQSRAFIGQAENFAAAQRDMEAKPETQGNGEERIRFDLAPESAPKESDDETATPSVLGGF